MWVPPRPLLVLAAATAVGTGASACGASGYQYIENDDVGLYAKLPDDWTVYDETDLFPDESEREREMRAQGLWVRTFTGAADADVEASQQIGDDPVGQVVVQAIGPDDRETFDLQTLRGGGDPARDPMAAQGQDLGEDLSVTVLSDESVTFAGGFSGVHTVFVVQMAGDATVTDRTAVRNADTTVMAVFEVSCTERCYSETHQDEIADIVESWTIEEVDT
jgi:hypothetical protein